MKLNCNSIVGLASVAILLGACPKGSDSETANSNKPLEQTVEQKVTVEFFVMSHCPFGLQVEKAIAPVLKNMGGDIDFQLGFIGQEKDGKLVSMHGQSEVDGDKVQLCAIKYNPNKYMDMILCMNKNVKNIPGNWEDCAKSSGLDAAKIKTCYEGTEGENLLKASFAQAKKRRARGSPTIYIGGKHYRGPRSEKAFARAICDAFTGTKPSYCASIPPPVKVPITIVTDSRCRQCRPNFWEERMKSMFPGAEVTIYDYQQEDGKKIFTDLDLKLLPAILFGKAVEETDNYRRIKRFLSPKGDYLAFRSGAKFDPTKEVCDNKIDDTGNGLIDCKDPDCKKNPLCLEKCNNGKDDTGNGLIDCKDPDCKNDLVCRKEIPNKLDVFVMSQCPFGVKALNAMKEVLNNFKKKIKFDVHYIATAEADGFKSLHGQPEVDEDIRESCAIKYYRKNYKYMDYILCRNENIRSADWKKCTGKNGIKTKVIEKCSNGPEGKKLLRKNIEQAQALGFSASPTWLANNKYKFDGIDAETIRKNICKHNSGLKNCNKKLSGPQQKGGSASCK